MDILKLSFYCCPVLLWNGLILALSIFTSPILVLLLCMTGVAENPDQQPFLNISFKMLNDFVLQHFSSQVSLATVLMILFSLTENKDLLNLHSC